MDQPMVHLELGDLIQVAVRVRNPNLGCKGSAPLPLQAYYLEFFTDLNFDFFDFIKVFSYNEFEPNHVFIKNANLSKNSICQYLNYSILGSKSNFLTTGVCIYNRIICTNDPKNELEHVTVK